MSSLKAPRVFDRLRLIAAVSAALPMILATPAGALAGEPDDGAGIGLGEAEPSLAVFELYYKGQKFEKTPEYARKVFNRIEKLGGFSLLNRDDAAAELAKRFPRSDKDVLKDRLDGIRTRIKMAEDKFFQEGVQAALGDLIALRQELESILEHAQLEEEMKKELINSQMLLALVYIQNEQRDEATEVVDALVRRVGEDSSINDDNYHPDAVQLYRERVNILQASRQGKIEVRTNPPGADVYINGIAQGRKTPATYEGLFTGAVRVVAKKDNKTSRMRTLEIDATTTQSIEIDLDFENALVFGAKRVGLEITSEQDLKRNLPRYAAKLAEVLDVEYIAVVGLVETDDRANLEGHLVNVETQKILRGTKMFTRPNIVSKNRVIQMGRFIVFGENPQIAYRPWYENTIGWILTGVGIVGGGVGTLMYLSYLDDKDIATCDPGTNAASLAASGCEPEAVRRAAKDDAESSRTIAYAVWGVGAASLIGGILAFALINEEDPDAPVKPLVGKKPKATTFITPTITPDGGVGIGAQFTF